jgi:hypothetical protein
VQVQALVEGRLEPWLKPGSIKPNPKANRPQINADERRSKKLKELSALTGVYLRPEITF